MADVYSDLATVQKGGTMSKLLPNVLGGRVRSARACYVAAAGVAAGSVIHLVTLPSGARVLPISTITVEAGFDAATTFKVGTIVDDDKFLAVVTMGGTAAVVKTLDADRFAGSVDGGKVIATTGGATLTEGKKVIADIYYVVD